LYQMVVCDQHHARRGKGLSGGGGEGGE